MAKIKLPEYVKMVDKGKSTVLRHTKSRDGKKDVFYKDAGCWSVGFIIKNGKMYSTHNYDNLNGRELFPATKKEWFIDNEQYISEEEMVLDQEDLYELMRSFINDKKLTLEFFEFGLSKTDYSKSELGKALSRKYKG